MRRFIRTQVAAAILLSTAVIAQPRGSVSSIAGASAFFTPGSMRFTIRGTNPCSSVNLDYGDGTVIAHEMREVPFSISHEYFQAGTYRVRARGMGNCTGEANTSVSVLRVRPREGPQPVPPAPPVPPVGKPDKADKADKSTTITVPGREAWTDTGIDVRAGDELKIDGKGKIQFGPQKADTAGPNGVPGNRRATANAPLPRLAIGALIARVGNSAPFDATEKGKRVREPESGRLYLGINDGNRSDNSGEFRVTVSIKRGR